MFYDRPQKKPKRPRAVPAKRGLFARIREERREKERLEEERRRALEAREARKRHSLWRFFFTSPRRAPEPEPEPKRTSWFRFFFAPPKRAPEPAPEPKRSLFRALRPEESPDYETPMPTPPAKRRGRHWFLRVSCALLAFLALCACLLYLLPVGLWGHKNHSAYLAGNSLPSGYTHVLLIGIDRDTSGTSRSDTMIIASVGKGGLKLTSLLRDTGVSIPGASGTHRLNAAYAYGGAELLVKTVNQNYGLNITRYALADYNGFVKIVDLMGGLAMDITQAEMGQINANLGEVLYRNFRLGETTYTQAYDEYLRETLAAYGENTRLTGMQALGYARIRNLDSDYGRTNRQRKLLSAAAKAMKGYLYRPISLANIAINAISLVETNMNAMEILSLGEKALLSGDIEQTRLPVSGTYKDDGGMFYNIDFAANRAAFLRFVYGE